jgi:hypothetical protein
MVEIWRRLGDQGRGIIQAHNGYIETYLNLGLVGLLLLGLAVFSAGLRAIDSLWKSYPLGVLRLLIIAVAVIYNYTEAAYKPLHNIFVLLLYASLQVRTTRFPKAPARALRSPISPPSSRPLGGRAQRSRWSLSELRSPSRRDASVAASRRLLDRVVTRGGVGQWVNSVAWFVMKSRTLSAMQESGSKPARACE